MKTRRGKIARLPQSVREPLNRRLADGEPAGPLLAWLNELPEVQAVLQAQFGGTLISEQNLSAWRQGGFVDWQTHQEARAAVRLLVEQGRELAQDAGELPLGEVLAAPLAVALAQALRETVRAEEDPATQRQALLAVAREITQLRRCDNEAARTRVERERWAAEQGKTQAQSEAATRLGPLYGMVLASVLGDSCERKVRETGRIPPEVLHFLATVAPDQARAAGVPAEYFKTPISSPIKADQGESSPIQPS